MAERESVQEVIRGAWSVETLREHFNTVLVEMDRRFTNLLDERDRRYEERHHESQRAIQAALLAQKEAVNAALASSKEAVLKAETAVNDRFETHNKFREQISDQDRKNMPRLEAEALIKGFTDRVDAVEGRMERAEGRGGGISATAVWIAVAISLLALVVNFLRSSP